MTNIRELAAQAADARAQQQKADAAAEKERQERTTRSILDAWMVAHLVPPNHVFDLVGRQKGSAYYRGSAHVVIDDVHLEWVGDYNASYSDNHNPPGQDSPCCFLLCAVIPAKFKRGANDRELLRDGEGPLTWTRWGGSYPAPIRSLAGLGNELEQRGKSPTATPYTGSRRATDKEIAAWMATKKKEQS